MKNKDALAFYQNMSNSKSLNQNSVKLAKNSDFSKIDAVFIMKYANSHSDILDLGSGTGLIVNRIYKKINHIVAVESFKKFTQFIKNTKKIKIINKNIINYKSKYKFDLITLFAIVQYFNEKEIIKIYSKYIKKLKLNGKLIIKGQFGIKEDVIISGYSDELKTNYYSEYRYIKKETSILKKIGFINIKVFDIYPPKYNRWNNTHFFAIVGEKK